MKYLGVLTYAIALMDTLEHTVRSLLAPVIPVKIMAIVEIILALMMIAVKQKNSINVPVLRVTQELSANETHVIHRHARIKAFVRSMEHLIRVIVLRAIVETTVKIITKRHPFGLKDGSKLLQLMMRPKKSVKMKNLVRMRTKRFQHFSKITRNMNNIKDLEQKRRNI